MVLAFLPGGMFQTLSLSGSWCQLSCFYCNSRYISAMDGVLTPEDLERIVVKSVERGTKGFLISGGLDKSGRLINLEKYIPTIRKLKRDLGIVFSVHSGLVDEIMAEELSSAVDVVDYEFVFTKASLSAKGIKGRMEDYERSLELLIERGPEYIVPHIMLGLPADSEREVEEAIHRASSYRPYLLNFVVFTPTKGTPSYFARPPALDRILSALRLAKQVMGGRTSLGCMRPFQMKEVLDREVLRLELVERISNPSPKLRREFKFHSTIYGCCSLPENLLKDFEVKGE